MTNSEFDLITREYTTTSSRSLSLVISASLRSRQIVNRTNLELDRSAESATT